ncbi:sigma-70 family RNA polymerase sigma factor [Mucisphaera sp.]|uniref:sigma-70 family RNA polymerase sigma factor n=1 Tax=Mucisphaera sp. TaxID=2913024 RepID=UPI003D0C8521
MSQADDKQHLDAIRRGDRNRLEPLLRAHQNRLYALCLRILGNPEDAAEAAQDALIQIIQKLDTFQGRAALATWMSRIAINRAISLLRRRKSRPATYLSDLTAPDQPDYPLIDHREPSPDQRVQDQEEAQQLAAALQTLEERYRVALVLRDIEGMSYDEIAEITGLALGTVKSRIFRARLALRQAIDDANLPSKETARG